MAFTDKYPYTDFHELNLDWFLEEFKKVVTKVEDLDTTVQQFTEFVTNYFDDLDVQEEINRKLDAMALDGTLSALLLPIVTPLVIDETDTWLADNITNPSSPPLDTSLSLATAAAPAKTVGDELKLRITNKGNYTTGNPLSDMDNAPINACFNINYPLNTTAPANYPTANIDTLINTCISISPSPNAYNPPALQIVITADNFYFRRRNVNDWSTWTSLFDGVNAEFANYIRNIGNYTAGHPLSDMDAAPINTCFFINYALGSTAPANYPTSTIDTLINYCVTVSPSPNAYNDPSVQIVMTADNTYIRRISGGTWSAWKAIGSPYMSASGIKYFDVDSIHCVAQFPSSYSANGKKSKMIILCHGAGFKVKSDTWGFDDLESNNSTSNFRVNLVNKLVNAGYVVCDCNGQTNGSPLQSFGAPKTIDAYYRLYEHMIKNYNVEEICSVYGFSMGALVALNLVNNHKNIVKALCLGCGITSLRDYAFYTDGGWRVNIANNFEFANAGTYTTGAGTADAADMAYYDANVAKTISHDPTVKYYVDFPPVNLFTASDDAAVSPTQTTDFITLLTNAEVYVESNIYATGGHGISYGNTPSIITNYVIPFFEKFNV